MGTTLSTFDKVLKDVYLGPIRKQFAEGTILMSRLKKTADYIQANGRDVITPLHTASGQGIGARGDAGALPVAGNNVYIESKTTIKHNYGRINITGPTIRATKKDSGAFANALDSDIQNMVDATKRDINRQMITGIGVGTLAAVDAYVAAATTLTVKNAGGVTLSNGGDITDDATMYMLEGAKIDVYDSTLATNRGSFTITKVDEATNVVTIDAAVTGMVSGDLLIRYGSKDYEMMGLYGIIDDGSVLVTLQNLSSSTYPIWRAKRFANGGTLRDISPTILQQGYSYVEKKGLAPSLGITSFAIRDSYANGLTTVRQLVNTKVLEFGFEALVYNSKPIVPDDQCPNTIMWWIVESLMAIHQQTGFDWAQEDGKILAKVTGYDMYEAFLYYDAELATFRRNAHCVILDLK